MKVTVEGKEYTVAHQFSADRCLIDFEGVYVFCDRYSDGVWELSGEPAREHEKPVLAALVAPMLDKTDVKVTPPDGD